MLYFVGVRLRGYGAGVRESPLPPEIVYQLRGQWVRFPIEKNEVTIGRDVKNDQGEEG